MRSKQISHRRTVRWMRNVLLLIATMAAISPDTLHAQHRSRVSLECLQLGNQEVELTALVRARIGRSYVPMAGLKVDYFVARDSIEEVRIGSAETDERGFASIRYMMDGTSLTYAFRASFAGNDTISDDDATTSVVPAVLTIEQAEDDSLNHQFNVLIQGWTADGYVPVEDVPVEVFVRRMLSDLKVFTGTTDADGRLLAQVPGDLPGDANETLDIVARVTEHDTYGSLSASILKTPRTQPIHHDRPERALWTDAAPLWMLITFFVLMGTVWGHYLYILLQLVGIKSDTRKLQQQSVNE
ncbi:MAG: hypothetical protein R3301_00205 [Saprospiraceae bacterium]|nr:hypothetical protein [Saprospiraceae bacterium]